MPYETVSANIFSKCLPAFGTDISHCGTVTVCDVATLDESTLELVFFPSGRPMAMSALLMQDFEIKMCGAIQNGLYDFLIANSVDMSKRITKVDLGKGRFMIMPFLQAEQKSRINNEYWAVSGGTEQGVTTGDWIVTFTSTSGIPASERWFNSGMRIFIDGLSAGGTATRTAWMVTPGTIPVVAGANVTVELTSQNDGSFLGAVKAPTTAEGWPVTGLATRGTPNVSDWEEWCEEGPGLNPNKLVPFWIETVRNSLCSSELYDQYRDMVIDDNPYYKKFIDVPEVEKNAQLGRDWQSRFANTFFWNKAISANQDLTNWRSLDQISTAAGTDITPPDEGACVGYRANAIGVYEQLAECGRVHDLQGQVLNLQELFKALYRIQQARKALNQPSDQIDIYTDSEFASKIQQGMIEYFDLKSGGRLAFNFDVTKPPTPGKFGFRFNSYPLDWPVLTLNVVTHQFFDDRIDAAKAAAANLEPVSRFVWILDWSNIYAGILASNRVVNQTGDLKTRAAVDSSYMCVMRVPSRRQTLTSVTWTAVVECPDTSLILENISDDVPEHAGQAGELDYYGEY